MSLGCEPEFSHPADDKKKKRGGGKHDDDDTNSPESCFPLPVCRSFKQTFKDNQADKKNRHRPLIAKQDFSGDPDQAHWTSDYDHIAPHALIDSSQKRLVLKARRDTVKTQSGGGFGATISSTRWNRYGVFNAKFKAGASGPGIVAAMMLSNPFLGEEITFEVTGGDPKTIITDFYRHSAQDEAAQRKSGTGAVAWLSSSLKSALVPSVAMEGLQARTRRLKNMILHKEGKHEQAKETKDMHDKDGDRHEDSLEMSHEIQKSAAENELVYKIEWTPDKIQWSVDGIILRTLTAKELLKYKGYGLPSQPMLLEFTIWDAGHNNQTSAWSGGKTDYGPMDEKEYTTLIDWVDIACFDTKEFKRSPWPGAEASKRLSQAVKLEEQEKAAKEKAAKKSQSSGDNSAEPGAISTFVDATISTLLRLLFILAVLTGSASFLTRPGGAYERLGPRQTPFKKDHGQMQ
ncbi:concanavalin A-like lectin/glucanase domain-containing protein [Mortierella sp. GBAus27b]|nr:hypothetical protein BGX31_006445 [Mortierella sp. GBA43]KAI8362275.1 concanavalin A-like lectin/glucanase domain-containing protein [Mortierella sp. GBAus27b]